MTPPRLFPSQEALEWLRIASRDIRLAELALADNPPLAGEASYHAQEAAENALKGYLVHNNSAYPLTHDQARTLVGNSAGTCAAALQNEPTSTGISSGFMIPFVGTGQDGAR